MDSQHPLRAAGLALLLLVHAPARPVAAADPAALPLAPRVAVQGGDDEAELDRELASERAEADRLRRRGELPAARRILAELLADDPDDGRARLVLGRCRFDEDRVPDALREAERALEIAEEAGDRALFAEAARDALRCRTELGDVAGGAALLDRAGAALGPSTDPRTAWVVGRFLSEAGRREAALAAYRAGAEAAAEGWAQHLDRARCERALGLFERASRSLVRGLAVSEAEGGVAEPDLLAELGWLYYEVYREVDGTGGERRSAARVFREALAQNPLHLRALLGEYELYRYNWRRQSRSSGELLAALLAARPNAIPALLAAASSALDDGQLPAARQRLARLRELAPARRDVRTEEAALAWVEHRRDEARAALAELARVDPGDGRPEREVGRHLCELYRFGEAVPFLRASVERDGTDPDAWKELGRALANTGAEDEALAALRRAEEVAGGRRDAWRNNVRLALERMQRECVVEDEGDLVFVWRPDAADVLRAYLPDFYREARGDLSRRYGFTPGPVRIEVFREHADFSARSTGFEGFPATGVCFGPVVTALSPLSELRGTFSWARTSFHEFSHVVHLGLSNNRCPRWITEGLATWEEVNRDPSWTRNMRRELLDARANGEVIPVRELNGAFRGPRILFGYYQGGLLCRMLIDQHGFAPMVRLLEAFDRGADLDQAFAEVFAATPEEVDARFARFVDDELEGLALEPRWDPRRTALLRLSLSPDAPERAEERGRWREDWTTVAWTAWQSGNRVDAEQALRTAARAGTGPRALFLRGEMALRRGDSDGAERAWKEGLAGGGEDFRVRMGLGAMAAARGDDDAALEHLAAAERAFPGFADGDACAEKKLALLHERRGERELAMQARVRWLEWDSSDLPELLAVARWQAEEGRAADAALTYRRANDIDPFRRGLHLAWGRVLAGLGRHAEAEREFRTGLAVPPELDADVYVLRGGAVSPDEHAAARAALAGRDLAGADLERELERALGLSDLQLAGRDQERALLLGLRALELLELGRGAEARGLAEAALALDDDCEPAVRALARLQ